MNTGLVILLLAVLVYALLASRLNRWLITMPIFFMAAGALLVDFAPGFAPTAHSAKLLTEVTLALLLFADASTLSFHRVLADNSLPDRLLLIGLPLSILFGGLAAWLFFPGQGIWFALLIGSILAPTDAALGLAIFNNEKVPLRIRRALNVESGLNDGIVTPFVTLFIALTLVADEGQIEPFLLPAITEIATAIGVAILVGVVGGKLFGLAQERKWSPLATLQLGGLALALVAYAGSVSLGGNGFIAAFVSGLLFGLMARHHAHQVVEFTEVTGTLLSVLVWAMFGGSVVLPLLRQFDLRAALFAVLALTLVRMLTVAIAMQGSKLRRDTIALMGWFGPRGLASVVFTLIALEALQHEGRQPDVLLAAAGWTIMLSVVLHGISAQPLADWYARRLANAPANIPELEESPEVRILRSQLGADPISSPATG